jgi:hypothetical protein
MDHWGGAADDPWADARGPTAAGSLPPPSDALLTRGRDPPVVTRVVAPAVSAAAWAAAEVAPADTPWTTPWAAGNDGDDDYGPETKLGSTAAQTDNGGWGGADPFAAGTRTAGEHVGAEKRTGGGWSRASSEEDRRRSAVQSRRDSLQLEVRLQDPETKPGLDGESGPETVAVGPRDGWWPAAAAVDGTLGDGRADGTAEEDQEQPDDGDDAIQIRAPRPIEFLDLSLIDDLVGPRRPGDESPAPPGAPSSSSLLASTGAKRAWHKLSRRETLRAVDSGESDAAYVRVSWKVSRIRGDVMGIVARWRPQSGAAATVANGAERDGDVFRWDSVGPERGAASDGAPVESPVGTAVRQRSGLDGRSAEPVLFNWSSVVPDTGDWDTPDEAGKTAKEREIEAKSPGGEIADPATETLEELKPPPLLLKPSAPKLGEDHGNSVTIHSDLPLTPKTTEDDDWGDMVDSSREINIASPPITSSPSPSLTKRSPIVAAESAPVFSDSGMFIEDHDVPDDAPPGAPDDDVQKTTIPVPFETPSPSSRVVVDPRAQRIAHNQGPDLPAPFFSDLPPKAGGVRSYLIKKATNSQRPATRLLDGEDGPAQHLEDSGAFESKDGGSPSVTSETWNAQNILAITTTEQTAPIDLPHLEDNLTPPLSNVQIRAGQDLHEDAKRVIDGLGSFGYMLK